MKIKRIIGAASAVVGLTLVAACAGGSADDGGSAAGAAGSTSEAGTAGYGDINYWMWVAEQVPGYQACADVFEEQNPGTTVKIEQYNWDDYWTKLTASLVAGNPPDAFIDHLNKYGQFLEGGQIAPLDEYIAADSFDMSVFIDGLADPWVAQDGLQYGIPKDWDTIGLFYDLDKVEAGGYTAEDLENLDWNPQDGGSFETFLARMTIDKNGVRGDEEGFDASNVEVYGLSRGGGGGRDAGQSTWANFAGSTGWTHMDENPWGTEYNYDDPTFQETIDWYFGLVDKGYMPAYGVVASGTNQIGAGISTAGLVGSWSANGMFSLRDEGVNIGLTHSPVGPSGQAASMFNGVADSIPAGASNPEGAWAWISFMGTAECQDIFAEKGTAFPAIETSMDLKLELMQESGRDVSGYMHYLTDGITFLPPISENSAAIGDQLEMAMEAIYNRQADASSLTAVNDKINALFD
ncbi:ABC transporter substrate-binding protein [Demequina pelophila]|uniref:ABC transporter substrate-binding protein n=1 Tax=Demequina pelophila TaxID=1638984 RepID=UPI000783469C|nr:extracellular solute-binding protein [Demequina pelophila]